MLLQGPLEALTANFMTLAYTFLYSFTWLLNKNGKAHSEHLWENPVLYCIFRWNDKWPLRKTKKKKIITQLETIKISSVFKQVSNEFSSLLATVLQYCKVMFNLADGFCINFFSMTFSKVDWQIGPLRKWFATHCATVWLIPCVNSHMLIKVVALCKRCITHCATEWLFSCVNSHMLI
jgi:hypothetical protein